MKLLLAMAMLFLCSGCNNGKKEEVPIQEAPVTVSPTPPVNSIQVTVDPQNPTQGWILMGSGDEFTPVRVHLENGVWVLDRRIVSEEKPASFEELLKEYEEVREQNWR